MNEQTLSDKIAALRAELEPMEKELARLRDEQKRTSLARIEEIETDMRMLLKEAEDLANVTGITFNRQSFLMRVDNGYTSIGDYQGWESSSAYC